MHDTQNNTIKQVEYLDGFQYAGGVLQFFPTAEGYVAATKNVNGIYIYNYVYNYTDHLGNIRLSYTKDPVNGELEIMEENHYYPFGLKHSVYADPKQMYLLDEEEEEMARPTYVYETEYQYKYNGKEWQDELGLNMYDMDMRQYDPAIARWVVLDPVTHHSMSPYNAFDNNPVFWADPSGASVVTYTGEAAQEFIRREKKRLDDQIAQNAQKYGPPKDNWWRRTTKSIGCFFGINCGSNTPEPTQRLVMQKGDIEVLGIADDFDTTTDTQSAAIPENWILDLSYESSETQGESKMLNKDFETVIDSNNPLDSYTKTNYQFNNPTLSASAFGATNGEAGISLQPSIFGLVGISINGSINITSPQHSQIGIRFHENVNLNNTSSNVGVGIKPLGIIAAAIIYGGSRLMPPLPMPQANPNPIPTMVITK